MKSTSKTNARPKRVDELRPEYDFDYTKSKLNRFADRSRAGAVAVLLDPDVAKVFKTGESVNAVLRALMATMPARRTPAAR
jgi:hypothetical protein